MGCVFRTYKLQMVREESGIYECERKADTSKQVNDILRVVCKIDKEPGEKFYVLCLSTRNEVIGIHLVSVGNVNTSVIHPREIFQRAIMSNATSIIIAHNHPSGDPEPSRDDIAITEELVKASKMMGIGLLDHVVIGESTYVSMGDRNLVKF
jgi:DNA repair protein RadC